jgi:transposase
MKGPIKGVLHPQRGPRDLHGPQLIWADMGYRGASFKEWFELQCGWGLGIVQRPRKWRRYPVGVEPEPLPAFTVLPRRWVVE